MRIADEPLWPVVDYSLGYMISSLFVVTWGRFHPHWDEAFEPSFSLKDFNSQVTVCSTIRSEGMDQIPLCSHYLTHSLHSHDIPMVSTIISYITTKTPDLPFRWSSISTHSQWFLDKIASSSIFSSKTPGRFPRPDWGEPQRAPDIAAEAAAAAGAAGGALVDVHLPKMPETMDFMVIEAWWSMQTLQTCAYLVISWVF